MIFSRIRLYILSTTIIFFLFGCSTPKKSPPPTQISIKKQPLKKTTRTSYQKQTEILFKNSHKLFKSIPLPPKANINWKDLTKKVNTLAKRKKYTKRTIGSAHKILNLLKNRGPKLKKTFRFKWTWKGRVLPKASTFIIKNSILAPPELFSMWDHCSLRLKKQIPSIHFKLKSAWHSPAYQALLLLKSAPSLTKAFNKTPPPFFSTHQKALPAVTISMSPKGNRKNWNHFYRNCSQYGFAATKNFSSPNQQEFIFQGVSKLYNKLLLSKRIPKKLADNILPALYKANFFPSIKGLETILALSEKESSFQWNPFVNKIKKRSLKEKFEGTLFNQKSAVTTFFLDLLLSKNLLAKKDALIRDMQQLSNPENLTITEYDIYFWTRDALKFIRAVMKDYSRSSKVGGYFIDLNSKLNHLEFEPQTFGLWQSNVNNLLEVLQQKKWKKKQRYAAIYQKDRVNRHQLVRALSGFSDTLSQQNTLSLLFETTIKPAYLNHLQGKNEDLYYFASENLVGKMSTFRAPIQERLNKILKINLTVDGDLAHYYPYSMKINWKRKSNTQKAFQKYIFKYKKTLLRGFKHTQKNKEVDRLIREICQASTTRQLFKSKLYKAIMKDQQGKRIYPDISSRLYGQSPFSYAKKVFTFASQYQ